MPKAIVTFTVNSTADDPIATPTSTACTATNGKCTLRAAVAAADNLKRSVIVKLSSSDYVLADTIAGSMVVTDPGALMIEGISPSKTTISVKAGDHIEPFQVTETSADQGGVLFLEALTINGGSSAAGGALSVADDNSSAVLTDVDLQSNEATGAGGAIFATGHLWITDSTLRANRSGDEGGAILLEGATAIISATTIISNTAGGAGGGLWAEDGTVSVTGGSVSHNTAGASKVSGAGAGIFAEHLELDLTGTNVDYNNSRDGGVGGGLVAEDVGLEMSGGQLSHNSATSDGVGAAAILETSLASFTDVTINSNSGGLGGLFEVGTAGVQASLDITGGSVSSNSSEALLAYAEITGSAVTVDVSGAVLDNNTTTSTAVLPCGAAVCAASAGGVLQLTLTNDTIEKDSVTGKQQVGGAVEAFAGSGGSGFVDMQGDTVDYDSTPGSKGSAGGALFGSVTDTTSPAVYSPLDVRVFDSVFEHDSVGPGGDGGAIGISTGTSSGDQAECALTMSGDTFEHDTAGAPSSATESAGGAVSIADESTGSISDSKFADNAAKGKAGAGGAVMNEAASGFRFVDDTFSSNAAGEDFGGLAVVDADVTVAGSSFSDNTAADGGAGAAFFESFFAVSDSTFNGNTSSAAGAYGGGVEALLAYGTISNSTITGNSAGPSGFGGGLVVAEAVVSLDSVTITSNVAKTGAGVYYDAPGQDLTVKDSIISHNTTKALHGTENDCAQYSSKAFAAASEGGDVLGSAKCVVALAGTDKVSTNPKLAPLAANGGSTETMALEAGSPALKRGVACLSTDQRGKDRPATACDSGAYELTKA
jgi:CSLREA domain-containing protein